MIVFRLLPRELAAASFEHLSHDKQEALIEALANKKDRLADLLNDLAPDDRTALLEELPGPVAQRLVQMLSPEEREVTTLLLGYPEESIGRLMTTNYVVVRPHYTIAEALEHIRRYGNDPETLHVIYVVDERWRLIDDLRAVEILPARPNRRSGS
jgi:magnesium transporter